MVKQLVLADRIRALCEAAGLTQTALADEAEINATALSRLLTGDREWRPEHLLSIARVLKTSPLELVAGTTAEAILRKAWVDPETFDKSERERLILSQDLAASRAEVTILRERVVAVETVTAERDRYKGESERLRIDLDLANRTAASSGKARDQALAHIEAQRAQWDACREYSATLAQMLNNANRQLVAVRQEAARTKASAGLITGLSILGGILIAESGGRRR